MDEGGGAVNSTKTASGETTSYALSSILSNYPLICALLAFVIAQSSKIVSSWYKENRWDLKQIVGSGGMPSSHSATVSALAVAVGFQDGFGGSTFAVALIVAFVVMYDASGVRLHAGRQAEVLNQIICELPSEHPLAESKPLRELLGHTPSQITLGCIGFMEGKALNLHVIAGATVGIVTAAIGHFIFEFA